MVRSRAAQEVVDLGQTQPKFIGPLVLSSLAYPEEKYADLRIQTAFRLAGKHVLEVSAPEDVWFPTALGGALPVDLHALYGGAKRFDARIRKRIDAGWMALKPLLAVERGERPRRLGNFRGLSHRLPRGKRANVAHPSAGV